MEHHSEKSVVIPSLLVVLMLAGTYIYFFHHTSNLSTALISQETTKINVTNLLSSGVKALPNGLPQSLPVEKQNITESFSTVYKDRGVIQNTVSYTSKLSSDELWKLYSDYLLSNGFNLDKTLSNKSLGELSGTDKNGSVLTIIISSHNKVSLVQINFIQR